jgi:hypothetical protein
LNALEYGFATRRALEHRLAERVGDLEGRVPLELEDVRLEQGGRELVVVLRARDSAARYGFRLPAYETQDRDEWTPDEWADVLLQGIVEEVEAADRGLPVTEDGADIVWVD